MQKKRIRRDVNGVLIFNKPTGITSNAALQKVRYLFNAKKAGHTGSLDRLQSGVLPICFGEATKFLQFLLNEDKYYKVTAKLGAMTDTSDSDGNIIKTFTIPEIELAELETILNKFKGEIDQIPSMFSAIKYQGKPLYEYARKGQTVERESRKIFIYSLDLINKSFDEITLMVKCSKGTYIRTLVEDIGKELGCGAYVTQLQRLGVGPLSLSDTVSLDELISMHENKDFSGLDELLKPTDSVLYNLEKIQLPSQSSFYFIQGNQYFS